MNIEASALISREIAAGEAHVKNVIALPHVRKDGHAQALMAWVAADLAKRRKWPAAAGHRTSALSG